LCLSGAHDHQDVGVCDFLQHSVIEPVEVVFPAALLMTLGVPADVSGRRHARLASGTMMRLHVR
jgi:hypothetical protein